LRRFVVDVLLFLMLQGVITGGLLWLWPLRGDLYQAAVIDKHRVLRSAEPPRIIFVGGSSLAFGLDSRMVRAELQRETVNMAVQATLGDRYMLAEVESELGEGDTVVLGIESVLFPEDAGSGLVEQVLLHTAGSVRFIRDPQQLKLMLNNGLGGVQLLTTGSVRTTLSRMVADEADARAESHSREAESAYFLARYPLCHRCTQGTSYSRRSFNGFGDHVAHWGAPSPTAFAFEHDQVVGFNPLGQMAVVERLNRFARRCRQKGVAVAYVRPPMSAVVRDRWRLYLESADAQLQQRLELPILGELEDAVYPRHLFFDSPHHLTGEGVIEYTRHIMELLAPLLPPRPPLMLGCDDDCPPMTVAMKGLFDDGWTSSTATVCVYRPCVAGSITLDVACHTPAELLPVTVRVHSLDREVAHLVLDAEQRTGEVALSLEEPPASGFVHYEISVNPTFVPAEWNPASPDGRQLGVVITLER